MNQTYFSQSAQKESWNDISLPSYEKSEFSPTISSDFAGIAVWSPETITMQKKLRIPLFGVVQFQESELIKMGIRDRHPLRAVVVGVIIEGINVPFVGNAVLQSPLFPADPGKQVREYFNIDMIEATGMPKGVGTYFFFASVGFYTARSVKVTIE